MQTEPDWLRAQREETRKQHNFTAGSAASTPLLVALMCPLSFVSMNKGSMAILAIYFVIVSLVLSWGRHRLVKGGVARYMLIIVSVFTWPLAAGFLVAAIRA